MSALAFTFGWTLLHFLWQGTALALLVWIGLALVRHGRPETRYALACAGLLVMTAAPVLTFVALRRAEPAVLADRAETAAPAGTAAAEPPASPIGFSSRSAPLVGPTWRSRLDRVAPRLLPLWALGVLLLSLRLAGGLGWLARARRRSRATSGEWPERVEILRRHFGVAQAVALRILDDLEGPMVVGVIKPVILVPAAVLTGLPATQVELLLAHELAHIARHDVLANALQRAVETLLFFHPAVWWLSARLRQERERCCDAMAADLLGDPCGMAEALTSLEALHHLPLVPAFALGASGGSLTERVQALLGFTAPVRRLRLLLAGGLVLVCVGTGLGLWRLRAHRLARLATQRQARLQGFPGGLWLRGSGSEAQIEFEVHQASADDVLAAFARAEARLAREGGTVIMEGVPAQAASGKNQPETFTVPRHSLSRSQFLEYWSRLKARPALDCPATALVVRRDNLALPWDPQEDPPLDIWVPKHAEQFNPEAARLLREAVQELKALAVTPGRPQEVRKAVPEAILATLRSPDPGMPTLRAWDTGREEALFKLCQEAPFEPMAGLRYELNHLQVALGNPSAEDGKALQAAKEALTRHRVSITWNRTHRSRTAREQQARKAWEDQTHQFQAALQELENGLVRKSIQGAALLLRQRLAKLGGKPIPAPTGKSRLRVQVGLPPSYSANVFMVPGRRPIGHPTLTVGSLTTDADTLRASPAQEIALLQSVEATLQACLRGEHGYESRTLW